MKKAVVVAVLFVSLLAVVVAQGSTNGWKLIVARSMHYPVSRLAAREYRRGLHLPVSNCAFTKGRKAFLCQESSDSNSWFILTRPKYCVYRGFVIYDGELIQKDNASVC